MAVKILTLGMYIKWDIQCIPIMNGFGVRL